MIRPLVALSKVADGNMYIPTDTTNAEVVQNRERWLQTLDISLNNATRVFVTYDQPDFCRYRVVNDEDKGDGMRDAGKLIGTDALVTTQPGHALFLPVADCVATVFFDEEHSVIMLSHLGRHSLEQQGGVESVKYLT